MMPRSSFAPMLALLLCSCAAERRAPSAAPAPRPVLQGTEAVWHLRVGLNVAALMCKGRGRVGLAGDYGRVINRHRGLFDAAYQGEKRRHGSAFEQHQTRVYNRFANQRDPAAFCRRAADVAKRALELDSPALSRSAGSLVAQID